MRVQARIELEVSAGPGSAPGTLAGGPGGLAAPPGSAGAVAALAESSPFVLSPALRRAVAKPPIAAPAHKKHAAAERTAPLAKLEHASRGRQKLRHGGASCHARALTRTAQLPSSSGSDLLSGPSYFLGWHAGLGCDRIAGQESGAHAIPRFGMIAPSRGAECWPLQVISVHALLAAVMDATRTLASLAT